MLPPDAVVLLTGGTGFLGRHLLDRLLIEGGEIHAVNRAGAGPHAPRVHWHSADLRSADAASNLIREVRPTHLLHSAWTAVPGRFWTDPDNLDWLSAGLALAREFGEVGGRRFVGVGTCAEYAPSEGPLHEDNTPIAPDTLYGWAKAAMWAAANACAARYGYSAAWGRVFLPYGSGDAPERLIPAVIRALRAEMPVALSAGTQERDFVFAPDAADLLVRLLASREAGAFNVGTGVPTPIRQVVERIADTLGGRSLLRFGALPMRAGEAPSIIADMTKVKATLGWVAPTTLCAGVAEVLDRTAETAKPGTQAATT